LAEGRAEGRVEAFAEEIVRVLRARGLSIFEDRKQQSFACADGELGRWLERAVTVSSAEEPFR